MKLKDEIKKYWKQSPTWAKIYLGVSTFVASGSIASLSDTVFAWKGFILDGIELYRKIVNPLKGLIDFVFHAQLTQNQIDLIIIFCMLLSAYRIFITRRWSLAAKSFKGYAVVISVNIILWLVTFALAVGLLLDKFHIIATVLIAWYLLFVVLYPLLIYYFDLIPEDHAFHKTLGALVLKSYVKNKVEFFVVYYSPLAAAIAFVFILAAINNGLTR